MSWHEDPLAATAPDRGMGSSHGSDELTITVLAARSGVEPATIRRYERFGLVSRRGEGHVPRYAEGDVERVLRIRRLTTELGVNLAGAEVILHMREQILFLRRELEALRREREIR
ncbi:MAG: MerR family transcriptional regulator [Chloroflexota bacterium]|nr:MerR family transcriptional regulator [Chloroflexota bacterium]MDP9472776.1 MerR family transcriptional regulator [Chloroflexota bacterium]